MLFFKKIVYFNKNLKVLKVVWNVGYTYLTTILVVLSFIITKIIIINNGYLNTGIKRT